MKLALVLLLAYLVAGIFYVWRDLAERNPLRRTVYVIKYRQTGNRAGLILAGIGWLPGTLINAFFARKVGWHEAAIFGVFAGAAIIFWLVSN